MNINEYIDGLRRTVSIVLFLFVIVLLVSYGILVATVSPFSEWAALVVVVVVLCETAIFAFALHILSRPVKNAKLQLDETLGEEKS